MLNNKIKPIRKYVQALIFGGLLANSALAIANAEGVTQEDLIQQEKIKARLAEIAEEEKAAKRAQNGYYVERKSYGTGRETEPPRYVKQLNKTWLRDINGFEDISWLDIGLDYRFRYEYRDNDFRRSSDTLDEPFLLRTRGFIAIKISWTLCASRWKSKTHAETTVNSLANMTRAILTMQSRFRLIWSYFLKKLR